MIRLLAASVLCMTAAVANGAEAETWIEEIRDRVVLPCLNELAELDVVDPPAEIERRNPLEFRRMVTAVTYEYFEMFSEALRISQDLDRPLADVYTRMRVKCVADSLEEML